MGVPAIGEEALIDEVQQRLIQKYAHLTPGDVSAAVEEALIRFERSSIRDFVPLLVERRANAHLSTGDSGWPTNFEVAE